MQKQNLKEFRQPVNIDSSLNCFNIKLVIEIVLNCSSDNQIYSIQLINIQIIIAYQLQLLFPIQTKLSQIKNGTLTLSIYAQYFENY
ncbi:unnamed protein product [Paramecium pentaurelia]|uniref:Uncharacterized protein n=1 Tax=Paramecium pentaurelia TaxID=43138 RepID=A0A8S1UH73_9CILI|nr:unnamed protein product [Paramecium pentaurelia]